MDGLRVAALVILVVAALTHKPIARWVRARRYLRGRTLKNPKRLGANHRCYPGALVWGTMVLPESAATQHFLAAGATGSGKSLVQRRLMKEVLLRLHETPDARVLIYDAKGDSAAYLAHIGYAGPVYSLNPFESRDDRPKAVAWDIAADVTSPTDALNLACSLIEGEEGTNRYFSNAARLVVRAVILSLIKHSPGEWTFADLVLATTSRERLEAVLSRDEFGRDALEGFLPDSNTGHCVASTIYASMVFYEAVAAQWQRVSGRLSLKDWLTNNSVLLLGDNEAASASLEVINRTMFRFLAEQIDVQPNSGARRTWVWVDELRLAGCILSSGKLTMLADKGRSRGVCLVLAFQDIEGFQEAAGAKIAGEIIAQCGSKALLRCQSKESAEWASGLVGQYECLEVFRSDNSRLGSGEGRSEQRVIKDAVLPSEFYGLPVTSRSHGLTGYFLTAEHGAHKSRIAPTELEGIVVAETQECSEAIRLRPVSEQWVFPWSDGDRRRLQLAPGENAGENTGSQRLRLRKRSDLRGEGAQTRHARSGVARLEENALPKAIASSRSD
ncbi:type IV secretory system conjugative DNA transfer family protein [Botrimarina mediterranea]|uniref:Coupling protein TraD n=1 Tax=Botrimarina mediterranea TaxID=2528022 RepID=A0A518K7B7_9BACT|nr:type IV secretion system DNA-binding domain-containing protein [Botrimarina mediterranea]QDV73678.1 Coupling protein TraD [Botrimarina mediterranea]QDV78268.1 Coupling protein TraD [Planctomycetes bacterium K2D]